jgi:hypothetical protein
MCVYFEKGRRPSYDSFPGKVAAMAAKRAIGKKRPRHGGIHAAVALAMAARKTGPLLMRGVRVRIGR